MSVKLKPVGLRGHPMEQRAVEALLDGETVRSIATWLDPPLSHSAVHRYLIHTLRPTMEHAETMKSMLPDHLKKRVEKVPGSQARRDKASVLESKTHHSYNHALPERVGSYSEVGQIAKRALLAAPALHIRENRLRLQQELADRLVMIASDRAADMSVCERCRRPRDGHPWERCDAYVAVPGGESGFIVRKLKKEGTEYVIDTGHLAELREILKHLAIEQGQWQEATGQASVSVQIVCPQAPKEAMPRVSFASDDALLITDGEYEEIGVVQQR